MRQCDTCRSHDPYHVKHTYRQCRLTFVYIDASIQMLIKIQIYNEFKHSTVCVSVRTVSVNTQTAVKMSKTSKISRCDRCLSMSYIKNSRSGYKCTSSQGRPSPLEAMMHFPLFRISPISLNFSYSIEIFFSVIFSLKMFSFFIRQNF